jgi:arginyl-tRNA synthetase
VLTAAEALRARRLALSRTALAVLSQGLNVLGIDAPEQM